jgi:hypothetical protein
VTFRRGLSRSAWVACPTPEEEHPVGLIPCATASIDPDCGTARFRLARLPEVGGRPRDAETIAPASVLNPNDIGCGNFEPSCSSAECR